MLLQLRNVLKLFKKIYKDKLWILQVCHFLFEEQVFDIQLNIV